jgi:hypothetical protein
VIPIKCVTNLLYRHFIFSLQAQLLFMGILIVALANFIVGSIMGPTSDDELSKGFIGYNRKASLENRHNILKHN